MSKLIYLLMANLTVWIILFGYIYLINRKQNRLEEKIKMMEKNE